MVSFQKILEGQVLGIKLWLDHPQVSHNLHLSLFSFQGTGRILCSRIDRSLECPAPSSLEQQVIDERIRSVAELDGVLTQTFAANTCENGPNVSGT